MSSLKSNPSKFIAALVAGLLALGSLGACSDEDGDGAVTDEEIEDIDEGTEDLQDEGEDIGNEIEEEFDEGENELDEG